MFQKRMNEMIAENVQEFTVRLLVSLNADLLARQDTFAMELQQAQAVIADKDREIAALKSGATPEIKRSDCEAKAPGRTETLTKRQGELMLARQGSVNSVVCLGQMRSSSVAFAPTCKTQLNCCLCCNQRWLHRFFMTIAASSRSSRELAQPIRTQSSPCATQTWMIPGTGGRSESSCRSSAVRFTSTLSTTRTRAGSARRSGQRRRSGMVSDKGVNLPKLVRYLEQTLAHCAQLLDSCTAT